MDSLLIQRHFSRNILLRLLVFTLIAIGLLYWNRDFIDSVYFQNQLTHTGYVINGVIAALFLLGLLSVILGLLHYSREETALQRFIDNMESGGADTPLRKVPLHSLISRRYHLMAKLFEARAPINHSALASTLVAAESSRYSTPRYINNILILTGVFGTIVALSLSLLGASEMLENSVNVGGMGIIIHGMSTALSTTITAIVCYVFFGYFNMKLSDVQTNLISGIEQVTSNYLMPRFQVKTENVLYEFTGLIRSLQGLVEQMEDSQEGLVALEEKMMGLVEDQAGYPERMLAEMHALKHILAEGFRLSEK
ncbi:MAG: hypothetical protein HQL47_00475 [Gammaproteobacteria bacterium]|nr:hypothetical protein [Gammaproteobacteria bacterium]